MLGDHQNDGATILRGALKKNMQDRYESLVETQSGSYILKIVRYSSKTIDSR